MNYDAIVGAGKLWAGVWHSSEEAEWRLSPAMQSTSEGDVA